MSANADDKARVKTALVTAFEKHPGSIMVLYQAIQQPYAINASYQGLALYHFRDKAAENYLVSKGLLRRISRVQNKYTIPYLVLETLNELLYMETQLPAQCT